MNRNQPHEKLLNWYDQHRRVLPWRALPGEAADPYCVWLSEIMLQQTTVATVKNRYDAFISRWPNVHALAEALLDDVLSEWAGLGYYARARNLHKCAIEISRNLGGVFPTDEDGLKSLPGIGDYTAAAISSIAYDNASVVVDGNVERVMARLFRIEEALPGAKKPIRKHAKTLTPNKRAGDYAQAVMDLGATICTPRKPSCEYCPWQSGCLAFAKGDVERFPVKAPKKKRPTRRATIYWLQREGSSGREVWMRRRPEQGLLGGMMEFPSDKWLVEREANAPPVAANWEGLPGEVVHIFTHFRLELDVRQAIVGAFEPEDGRWVAVRDLGSIALPTVMKKVAEHVLPGQFND